MSIEDDYEATAEGEITKLHCAERASVRDTSTRERIHTRWATAVVLMVGLLCVTAKRCTDVIVDTVHDCAR